MATPKVKKSAIPWSAPVSAGMDERWKSKLLSSTGKSLETWVAFARKYGPSARKERRVWLMEAQGLGRMFAWFVDAATERSAGALSPESLVAKQYDGPRAALLPVMEAVVRAALALGKDVRPCPCETMIPLYRTFVFAELRVGTVDRLDLGLALGDVPCDDRLVAMKGRAAGNRITHRISLSSPKDVDGFVKSHLAAAYELGDQKKRHSVAGVAKLPADVARALRESKEAGLFWKTLTTAMRNEWLTWITGAVKEETRSARVRRLIERMLAGKKKIW